MSIESTAAIYATINGEAMGYAKAMFYIALYVIPWVYGIFSIVGKIVDLVVEPLIRRIINRIINPPS